MLLRISWRSWPAASLPARQCERRKKKKGLYWTLLNQGGDVGDADLWPGLQRNVGFFFHSVDPEQITTCEFINQLQDRKLRCDSDKLRTSFVIWSSFPSSFFPLLPSLLPSLIPPFLPAPLVPVFCSYLLPSVSPLIPPHVFPRLSSLFLIFSFHSLFPASCPTNFSSFHLSILSPSLPPSLPLSLYFPLSQWNRKRQVKENTKVKKTEDEQEGSQGAQEDRGTGKGAQINGRTGEQEVGDAATK